MPALAFPLEAPGSGVARFVDAFPAVPAFEEPVFVGFAPGDAAHLYVVERRGRILRVANSPTATSAETFLDFGGVVDGQLRAWEHAGLLGGDLSDLARLPALARPDDPAASVAVRTRSTLDANCAMCHRPGGPGGGSLDLRASVAVSAMGVGDAPALHGSLGLADPRLVRWGRPAESVLWLRMRAGGPERMPPLATSVVDAAGSDLVRRWIESGP